MTAPNEKLAISLAPDRPLQTRGTHFNDNRGKEHITPDDVTLPRLAIAQKTSPQLEPDKPEYIEGLKLFQLFNTATGDIYGAGPVEFVVVRLDKRAMQFDANNNVIDHDVPLDDPRLQFTTNREGQRVKPEAVLFYDFLVILAAEPRTPAVLTLKGAGTKTAKKLNSLLRRRRGPAWLDLFKVTASKGGSNNFTYGVYSVALVGDAPADLQLLAENTYEDLSGRHVVTDAVDVPDEGDEAVPF
jgi:hypothetical protein